MTELVVSGHFYNLAQIGDFITDAAEAIGLSAKAVYGIQMAVDEACTNIIEHGYGGEGQGDIRLTCSASNRGLVVTIYDQGHGFDPETITQFNPSAALDERSSRGMGIFLMRKLVDEVDYQFQTPDGNQLTLIKYREV